MGCAESAGHPRPTHQDSVSEAESAHRLQAELLQLFGERGLGDSFAAKSQPHHLTHTVVREQIQVLLDFFSLLAKRKGEKHHHHFRLEFRLQRF